MLLDCSLELNIYGLAMIEPLNCPEKFRELIAFIQRAIKLFDLLDHFDKSAHCCLEDTHSKH
jgi:hypothetical protein